MPRSGEGTSNLPVPQMPEDVRRELLQAQAGEIAPGQNLPRVAVMPAGACRFEFKDSNDVVAEFEAVILGSHPRNVLWDVPFGTPRPEGERAVPACTSRDGKQGVPREGFLHAALGDETEATGTERIGCERCPYNQWESKHLVGGTGKGKACTNQRALYLMAADRALPLELVLPPTSMAAFDEYLTALLNRGVPSQALWTRFAQSRQSRGGITWGQVTFAAGAYLNDEQFAEAVARRRQFLSIIQPTAGAVVDVEVHETDSGSQDEEAPPF